MTKMHKPDDLQHRIVIVGGGAGGLQLATRLGDTLGTRHRARITLVDKDRSHLWKPKLHEIAAGSMALAAHELDFLAQAHWHHFRYRMGEMNGLDRARREIHVAPFVDEDGIQVTPQQSIPYDTLVIAIGSQSNDFGTPGVSAYAMKLETPQQAMRFHRRMVDACIRAHVQAGPIEPEQLQFAIIGAGATGVELAAELHRTAREVVAYGLDTINPEKDIKLHLIEAADRILPALPERMSRATLKLLSELAVNVYTRSRVAEITPNGVRLADGRTIPAEIIVWAAGVKAPDFLGDIDGLETNQINQLIVLPTLRTTRDENIFALGDCSACPWPKKGANVPPRAQAAQQQASHLLKQLKNRLAGRTLSSFCYRDFGSLVSLGKYSTVGNMMNGIAGGSLMIEGYVARIMYQSLYKRHELALHGFGKVTLDTVARIISRHTKPHVKLH